MSLSAVFVWDVDDDSVPDYHFLSHYTSDNANIKPPSCGLESWIWMKGPDDHSFHRRWIYLTDTDVKCGGNVRLGYIDDAESEFELKEEYLDGRLPRIVHELAGPIVNLENTVRHRLRRRSCCRRCHCYHHCLHWGNYRSLR